MTIFTSGFTEVARNQSILIRTKPLIQLCRHGSQTVIRLVFTQPSHSHIVHSSRKFFHDADSCERIHRSAFRRCSECLFRQSGRTLYMANTLGQLSQKHYSGDVALKRARIAVRSQVMTAHTRLEAVVALFTIERIRNMVKH